MTPENGNRDSSNTPLPAQDSRDERPGALKRQNERHKRETNPAALSAETTELGDVGDASQRARRATPVTPSDPPPCLPVRALGEYVFGGRVDAMRRLLRGR